MDARAHSYRRESGLSAVVCGDGHMAQFNSLVAVTVVVPNRVGLPNGMLRVIVSIGARDGNANEGCEQGIQGGAIQEERYGA